MNKLLIQRADCGIYLSVFLTQKLFKILRTLFKGTEAGTIFEIFVCEIIDLQIPFSGYIT